MHARGTPVCVLYRHRRTDGQTRIEGRRMDVAGSSYTNRATRIGMVIALYWVVSISMVFLNKYLLSSPDLRLDAPLFITWFQCLVAVVACWVLPLLRPLHPFFEMFPRFEVKPEIAIKCLPLSAVFVGMIAFNNLCLKEIGVSFYNVGRCVTPPHSSILLHTFIDTLGIGVVEGH